MLHVDFKPIAGNCAPVRTASETETKHAQDVASSVISKLQEIAALSDDEKQLLSFVKTINPNLDNKFGGCSDADKAAKQYSHKAVIGERVVYSLFTAPKSLEDLLMNLASTRTLFRAVRLETEKRDKASENLTFKKYVEDKQLPASVLAIAGVKEQLVNGWFEKLRSMQVSEGAIRNLCTASEIEYILPETATESTEAETATESTEAESTESTESTEAESTEAESTESTEEKPKQERKKRNTTRNTKRNNK